MRDLYHNLTLKPIIHPTMLDSIFVSPVLCCDGFDSLMVMINVGETKDKLSRNLRFDLSVHHGDDKASLTPVIDKDVQGLEVEDKGLVLTLDDGAKMNQVYGFGYLGARRYLTMTLSPVGKHGAGTFVSAVALFGHGHYRQASLL